MALFLRSLGCVYSVRLMRHAAGKRAHARLYTAMRQCVVLNRLRPIRERADGLFARMTVPANHIEMITRQMQVKRLDERSGGKLVSHKHIAEDPYALSGDHCLDSMQLLPEAQVLHVLKGGNTAPLAPCLGKPALPCGRIQVRG